MPNEFDIWSKGKPVLSESGLGELDFWLRGSPYVILGEGEGQEGISVYEYNRRIEIVSV